MPTLDVNGRSLNYTETGHGPAVVLVHGFPLDGRVWQGVADRLASRARVIVPDLRGFGRHSPETAFTLSDLADDLAGLMETLGIAPCPVAGLSMGGYVAQTLARKYPGIATKLILVDTKAEADSPEGKAKRDAMAELALTGGAKAVTEQMLPNMLGENPDAAVQTNLRSIMECQPGPTLAAASIAMRDREDFVDFLPTVESPIHFIFGAEDKISPASAIERFVGGRNTLTLIEKAGHMAPIENPQAVADAIAKSL